MKLLLDLILVFLAANALLADKALNILSVKELKRRARAGHDKKAANLFKLAAYGRSTANWLWITGAVSAGLLLVFLIPHNWLSVIIYSGLIAWVIRGWQPPKTTNSSVFSLASLFAPFNVWVLSRIAPLLNFGPAKIHLPVLHSMVYEKDDLLELIKQQPDQPDNRVAQTDLKIAIGALTFGDKKVGDIMTPLRKVRLVGDDESIGPMLMDELHQTGFSRFPVAQAGTIKSATPDIVGTLFLKDIILKEDGRVRDYMHKKTFFINETQSLREALSGFLKTHSHLFVVVNNFEEIVGVLSIEDVLEQILGEKIVDEFDHYDDLRAVAGLEADREGQKHDKIPVAPASE